jgi:rfaE bifunctional protein nucleotidyltransferase chain/domain
MKYCDKIIDLDELARTMTSLRAKGCKTALAHGCFDILHLGHIRYLARAREISDFLAVTVTPDAFVDKGPCRPVFSADHRAEVLAALSMVDAVAVNRWPTAEQTLFLLSPDLYVKGVEYEKAANDLATAIGVEAAACEKVGGRAVFIDEVVFSSSSLARRFYSPLLKK